MENGSNREGNVIKEDADRFFWELNERPLRFLTRGELNKIRHTTIAIAGFGGGGAITAELFARWGIARFRLLDMDKYEMSNMNRQLFATVKTLGSWKAEVAAKRIKEIKIPSKPIKRSFLLDDFFSAAGGSVVGAAVVFWSGDFLRENQAAGR